MRLATAIEYQYETEILDAQKCLQLLHEGNVGCIGWPSVCAPELRPVNYLVSAGSIVIRTGEGMILDAARKGLSASFLVFGINTLEHTGFSVSVTGKLAQLPADPRCLSLPLRPWASGRKDRFVALSLLHISGREIPPGRGNR